MNQLEKNIENLQKKIDKSDVKLDFVNCVVTRRYDYE